MELNKDLMVQLLLGTGSALGGKGSWQEALGGIIQKYKSSKEYKSMLQQLLSGLPQGASVKGDNQSLTFKMPVGAWNGGEAGQEAANIFDMSQNLAGNVNTPSQQTSAQPTTGTGGVINPFKVRWD